VNSSFAVTDRIRAEQVAALFQNVTLGVLGATAGALVLAVAVWQLGALDPITAATWTFYIAGCAAAHIALRFAYRHTKLTYGWRFWAAWFTLISLAEGIGWGWGSVFLAGNSDRFSIQLLVMIVTLNVAGGAIPAFSSYLPAFFFLFIPTTVPSIFWSIEYRNAFPEADAMLSLMLIFIVAMGGLGVRANKAFKELVSLRIRTDELADDLFKQKELAEQASLAKSTFLAAASHDLRQPIHALGLFVGALRALPLPAEGARLVERIEESTNAMDGLFSAILDISKLDAGVVNVQPRAFPIQSALDRVCNDQISEAHAKSISFVCCPSSLIVHTDRMLMERVLRNLVSNAIRHTAKGKVVVGCRRRGGKVRVEVWDTGPGIPTSERERIFQEYFQLQNPERDRSMGLGLGLAIVRRLTALLGCTVTLRSEVGKGSCFSVDIEKADRLTFKEDETEDISIDTTRGLVLVIDDEASIRDAMHTLLTGWGYSVVVAGSGAEMLSELAKCRETPKVIICDYRLRNEENGIEVIKEIQAECNEAIPAMLITGDTASHRLVEAQASGLLLLHKPVPNGKLRAAIVNLIASEKRNE
jgi:signal transduction histidine kinase/ActR/RegA family two-component response regulator